MNTTTRLEAQIDTEIAAAFEIYLRAGQLAESRRKRVEGEAGLAPQYRNPNTEARYAAELLEAEKALLAACADYDEKEARYEGWSRFFLVPGGHIHRSMYCSTCNRNGSMTQFGWLPELSGLTEADAVAAHGAILCTVCFPTAPVAWTNHYEELAKAKAAEKCVGSGAYVNWDLPNRSGYYSGNYGTCEECGERVTLTKTNKLRAHKAK